MIKTRMIERISFIAAVARAKAKAKAEARQARAKARVQGRAAAKAKAKAVAAPATTAKAKAAPGAKAKSKPKPAPKPASTAARPQAVIKEKKKKGLAPVQSLHLEAAAWLGGAIQRMLPAEVPTFWVRLCLHPLLAVARQGQGGREGETPQGGRILALGGSQASAVGPSVRPASLFRSPVFDVAPLAGHDGRGREGAFGGHGPSNLALLPQVPIVLAGSSTGFFVSIRCVSPTQSVKSFSSKRYHNAGG
uniref:Uncharacterized protein n=1 Tax=Chromera velia CCMP2878 TaxID=1169474 RepID=A0A0G4HLH6_9ALVE|eukprot:Cvel_28760.t1-p1 / transcript=Cvel_28760.t1 / gene=Cvel_28760 / organism=Chromera_velia_CCMP2878 / gene_product=hypothetical protein / transcript_product=hypothetical protein / location=Cvel_scaffold3826:7369-9669(-) / protein_length=248 / sequence_SO=supercontig / SO=protein_coding / is_pseudo=false